MKNTDRYGTCLCPLSSEVMTAPREVRLTELPSRLLEQLPRSMRCRRLRPPTTAHNSINITIIITVYVSSASSHHCPQFSICTATTFGFAFIRLPQVLHCTLSVKFLSCSKVQMHLLYTCPPTAEGWLFGKS